MCPTDDRTSPSEARRAEGAEVDRVLVPIEVLEADAPPGETPAFVRGMEVVLLGYHYVPLQSIPAQFRERHEDQARRRLGELADAYRETGAKVEERLAFVHDPERAIARAADQDTCGALLLARPTDAMERILAPVAGEAHLPRVLDLVASVMEAGAEVTLVRVVEDEDRLDEAELLLEGAEEKLVERGIEEERVVTEALASDDRLASIA